MGRGGRKENFIGSAVDILSSKVVFSDPFFRVLAAAEKYAEKDGIEYTFVHGMDQKISALFIRL